MDSLRNKGKTYREIAEEMGISMDAVNHHFRKQYQKLQMQDPKKYPARRHGRKPHPEKEPEEL